MMTLSLNSLAYTRFLAVRNSSALWERLTGVRVKPRKIAGRDVLSLSNGSALIEGHLAGSDPFFAGRIGTSELAALYEAMEIEFGLRRQFSQRTVQTLNINAGFFPPRQEAVQCFVELMFNCVSSADLLGMLGHPQFLIANRALPAEVVDLRALEPYYTQVSWGRALSGKHVLVIHPLADLIKIQFSNRRELFEREDVLPEFQLSTIPAVQSIANTRVPFSSWFEALDHMTEAMAAVPFDVVLVGAGAYGFPLAARAKAFGKQAIHMGGALQILFGIKGRRWDNHPIISKLYNTHWVRPSETDVPAGAELIEQGCYW
ncbi:hypothetical protein [Halomonas daqiaonensis]|uniref:hypothetical protein n=1 Tax=Halomonas daqiaonensis TaxID=650850 RepID=UPI001113AA85|nr:hypothetical protein [Halomonas daqiaonensis]